jgi:hypothetical protein
MATGLSGKPIQGPVAQSQKCPDRLQRLPRFSGSGGVNHQEITLQNWEFRNCSKVPDERPRKDIASPADIN